MPAQRALISPQVDFWMVGGLSLLFLLVCLCIGPHFYHRHLSIGLPLAAYYASFAINYPHFAFSYQLFYHSFWSRLRDAATPAAAKIRLIIAGLVAPAALVAYFVFCFALRQPYLMGYAVSAMFFFVGWHYAKQGYGALITLSVYKKIFYSPWEKRILLVNAYIVWLYVWVRSNSAVTREMFDTLPYFTLGLPHILMLPLKIALAAGALASIVVILRVRRRYYRGIPVNGVVGYASSSYLWLLLSNIHPAYILFTPFFHSLQYLGFVYKFKSSQAKVAEATPDAAYERHALRQLALFAALGIILGGGFMDILPRQIDHAYRSDLFLYNFFALSFTLLINIHHYFIDSAFWRRDNRQVQAHLFQS